MLKELHVVTFRKNGNQLEIDSIEPALFSFGTLIKAYRSKMLLGTAKDDIAKSCPNSIVGDFFTVFEMSNSEILYIAEDYDWIRNHCSD